MKRLLSMFTPLLISTVIILGLVTWTKTVEAKKMNEIITTNALKITELEESLRISNELKDLAEKHLLEIEVKVVEVKEKTKVATTKVTKLTLVETDRGDEIDLAWEIFEGVSL